MGAVHEWGRPRMGPRIHEWGGGLFVHSCCIRGWPRVWCWGPSAPNTGLRRGVIPHSQGAFQSWGELFSQAGSQPAAPRNAARAVKRRAESPPSGTRHNTRGMLKYTRLARQYQGMFRSLNNAEKVASVLVLCPIVPYSPPERSRSGYEVEAPCGGRFRPGRAFHPCSPMVHRRAGVRETGNGFLEMNGPQMVL